MPDVMFVLDSFLPQLVADFFELFNPLVFLLNELLASCSFLRIGQLNCWFDSVTVRNMSIAPVETSVGVVIVGEWLGRRLGLRRHNEPRTQRV